MNRGRKLINGCRVPATAAILALTFEGIIWSIEMLRNQVEIITCVLFAPC
jgi:hypothetical protein